jgi:hypothetical protein
MSDQNYSCPSAQPDAEEARIIGIVEGTAEKPQVAYLQKGVAVSAEMSVPPPGISATRIFRFSGKCVGSACGQFGDGQCQLGKTITQMLAPTVDELPACTIRATCRWFAENGRDACLRCPQVMTNILPNDPVFAPVLAEAAQRASAG